VRRRRQFALIHERICGESTVAFQSREGWSSSLLLLPGELCRVLGQRDGLVLAPMRDLVMLLPLEADQLLAHLILEEFGKADMNALDLPPFSGRRPIDRRRPTTGKRHDADALSPGLRARRGCKAALLLCCFA
jgi:hypothetical protein